MFEKLKIRIVQRALRGGQYLLAAAVPMGREYHSCSSILTSHNKILAQALDATMESHKEIREFILERAENYLKKRVVDTNTFIEKIKG